MEKTSKKDLVFESLIKEMKLITNKCQQKNFGTDSKRKCHHVLEFDYHGYMVEVELKEN